MLTSVKPQLFVSRRHAGADTAESVAPDRDTAARPARRTGRETSRKDEFSVKNYDPFYSFLRIFAPYDGKD